MHLLHFSLFLLVKCDNYCFSTRLLQLVLALPSDKCAGIIIYQNAFSISKAKNTAATTVGKQQITLSISFWITSGSLKIHFQSEKVDCLQAKPMNLSKLVWATSAGFLVGLGKTRNLISQSFEFEPLLNHVGCCHSFSRITQKRHLGKKNLFRSLCST